MRHVCAHVCYVSEIVNAEPFRSALALKALHNLKLLASYSSKTKGHCVSQVLLQYFDIKHPIIELPLAFGLLV